MPELESVSPGVSDGGAAGTHPPTPDFEVLAGSTTGSEHNHVRLGLSPIACWRVDDVRFDFDSSFVLPGVRTEMQMLASLIALHTEANRAPSAARPPLLSLFGHADPIGNDQYNKFLSGRRAAAIYGMLTRRVEVWEDLYDNQGVFARPVAGDRWGTRALQRMVSSLIRPVAISGEAGPELQQAVADFQRQNGLVPDGNTGPATRKKLFRAYLDKICVDAGGQPFQADPVAGFLGRNADAAGKGDFQGCGEFNPVLIFSQEEQDTFDQSEDKTPRDAANAPNRRVMALLFRPGSRINPARWPCPRAKEGPEGCRKRFWSDGARRGSSLPDADREYKITKDTFACRFYDRISNNSPCDQHLAFSREPVYFTIRAETVQVLDSPDEDGKQIGELPNGALVRVIAERYSEAAFFIRFERVDRDAPNYYEAPRPSPAIQWICVARADERFAYWSNIQGTPLSLFTETRDLDDRFSAPLLDV